MFEYKNPGFSDIYYIISIIYDISVVNFGFVSRNLILPPPGFCFSVSRWFFCFVTERLIFRW